MEMPFVVGDAESADSLAERPNVAFGSVPARVICEPDRTVRGVPDSVERWVDHTRFASAEMWLAGTSRRCAASVEAWQ
jgi:hypothetical protein